MNEQQIKKKKFFHISFSNSNVPQNVLQTLKKQCNPLLKKSFKERNPDVDMDEIQNNPNVPEDVKAAITGALSLTLEEDEADDTETCEDELPPVEGLETFDDDYIMDMSEDDGKKNRRKRIDENDEDWLTFHRKVGKPKKSKRGHKKRSKNRSENGETSKNTDEKIKKKRSRKSSDANHSKDSIMNSTLNSTISSTLDSTMNSTNTSVSGCEQLNNSYDLMNGFSDTNGYDQLRKEIKTKKTPKKRDSTEKPLNGIVKKTSRRQFTSLSAIMACIESVVKNNDASIPETTLSDVAIKTEPMENGKTSMNPENVSPMKPVKLEHGKIEDESVVEPKKKRRRSTPAKSKELLHIGKMESTIIDQCSSAPKPIVKKSPINGASVKTSRTSMKKVKFLS